MNKSEGRSSPQNLSLACMLRPFLTMNIPEAPGPQFWGSKRFRSPQNWGLGASGRLILGNRLTPIGRATCNRLDLNDMRYPETDSIRATRRFWLQTGLHPPLSDLPLEL